MSNLKNLQQRVRAVENIKKITDTMERVAAARLRQAQAKAENSRPYMLKMRELLTNLTQTKIAHPLFLKREVKKSGVIVIAGDRGLSGSYNSNVFIEADKFLKNYSTDNVELILIGRKVLEHYNPKNWQMRTQYPHGVHPRSTIAEIKTFAEQLVHLFLSKELDEIWLIYTQYISLMHRKVVVEKFLNLELPKEERSETAPRDYIFEPSAEEILEELLPRYCLTRIQSALYESYASELSARVIAMKNASKNSEEMIETLTLEKNKMRQRNITNEMIEITTGAQVGHGG